MNEIMDSWKIGWMYAGIHGWMNGWVHGHINLPTHMAYHIARFFQSYPYSKEENSMRRAVAKYASRVSHFSPVRVCHQDNWVVAKQFDDWMVCVHG